jgi:hypothetical protein
VSGVFDALIRMISGSPAQPPAQPVAGGPVANRLPNDDEVALARRSGLAYGTPIDGYMQHGAKMHTTGNTQEAMDFVNRGLVQREMRSEAPLRTLDGPHADFVFRSWLAAQQSPLAALGFDPSRMVVHTMPGQAPMPERPLPSETPMPPPRPASMGRGNGGQADMSLPPAPQQTDFSIGGMYNPRQDRMWTDGTPTSPLHESMHRGVQMLREAGRLPQNMGYEEGVVRATMDKTYGGAERGRGAAGDKQIDDAVKFYSDPRYRSVLKKLDDAAAQLIAERTPRGPR